MNWPFIDGPIYRYRDGSNVYHDKNYHPHTSTRFRNWEFCAKPAMLPELYLDRRECCGCTACVAVCPVRAIAMELDEEGFEYPVIDASACVCCRKCMTVCPFKNKSENARIDKAS